MNFRPTEHRTITEEQNMDVKERALEAHEKWAGKIVLEKYGLDAEGIYKQIKEFV